MHVCICMYACMNACRYACMCLCIYCIFRLYCIYESMPLCMHVCMLYMKWFWGPRSSPGTPGSWLPFWRPLACGHHFWSSVLGTVIGWRQPLLNTLKALKYCGKAWKSIMHDAHDFSRKLFYQSVSACCLVRSDQEWPQSMQNHSITNWRGAKSRIPLGSASWLPCQAKLVGVLFLSYFHFGLPNKLLSMKLLQITNTKRYKLWVKNLYVSIVTYHLCLS